MLILVFLRRMRPRTRVVVGLALVVAGLGLAVGSVAVSGLLVHGVITALVGVVFCASGVAASRRTRRESQPAVADLSAGGDVRVG